MALSHRRAARRELEAAKVLGSARVHRRRGERAPDVRPVELPNGAVLGAEVKTRRRLPRWATRILGQARGYFGPGVTPLGVISELGGAALVVLELRAFATLVGLDVAELPGPRRPRRRRDARQLVLLVLEDAP